MSGGWTDLDVTPAGRPAGAPSEVAPNPLAPGHDPFGSRPTRRRVGWVRIAGGVLLVAGGIAASIAGLVGIIGTGAEIEGRAVARGEVVEDGPITPVTFTVPPGGKRAYSIYLVFGGFVSQEPKQELTVRDTQCRIRLPGGQTTIFRGARQDTAAEIGQAASVGHFTSAPGRAGAFCHYTIGTRTSRRLRPERVAYVVTPGRPSDGFADVAMIVGGVFAATAGGFAVGSGARRRRRIR